MIKKYLSLLTPILFLFLSSNPLVAAADDGLDQGVIRFMQNFGLWDSAGNKPLPRSSWSPWSRIGGLPTQDHAEATRSSGSREKLWNQDMAALESKISQSGSPGSKKMLTELKDYAEGVRKLLSNESAYNKAKAKWGGDVAPVEVKKTPPGPQDAKAKAAEAAKKLNWQSKNIKPPTVKGVVGATLIAFSIHYTAKMIWYYKFQATAEEKILISDMLRTDFGGFLISSFSVVSQKILNLFIGGTSQILASIFLNGKDHPHRALLVGSAIGGYLNQRVDKAFEENKLQSELTAYCSKIISRTEELERQKATQLNQGGQVNVDSFDREFILWNNKRTECREKMVSHFFVTFEAVKKHSFTDFVQIGEQTAKIWVTWYTIGMAKNWLMNRASWIGSKTVGISTREELLASLKKRVMIEGAESQNLARQVGHQIQQTGRASAWMGKALKTTNSKLSSIGMIALGAELPDYAERSIMTKFFNRFFHRYGGAFWDTLWFLWAKDAFEATQGWLATTLSQNTLNLRLAWTDSEIDSNMWFRKNDLEEFVKVQPAPPQPMKKGDNPPNPYNVEAQQNLLKAIDDRFYNIDKIWETYRTSYIRAEMDAQNNEFISEIKSRQMMLHQKKHYYLWLESSGNNPTIGARNTPFFTDNGGDEDKVPWHIPEYRFDELESEIGSFYRSYSTDILTNIPLQIKFAKYLADLKEHHKNTKFVGPLEKESILFIKFFIAEEAKKNEAEIDALEKKRAKNTDAVVKDTYFNRRAPFNGAGYTGLPQVVNFINRSVNASTRHIPFETPYNLRDSYAEQLKYHLRLGIDLRSRYPVSYTQSREFKTVVDSLWNWWIAYKTNTNVWEATDKLRVSINETSFINITNLKTALARQKEGSQEYLANKEKIKWSIFARTWAVHIYDTVTELQRTETEFWAYNKMIDATSNSSNQMDPRLLRAFAAGVKIGLNGIDKTIGEGEDALLLSEAKKNDALGEQKKPEDRNIVDITAQKIYEEGQKAKAAMQDAAKKNNVDESNELDAKTEARRKAVNQQFPD